MLAAIALTSALIVAAVAWWWLIKDLIVRSPLDNIPGPPSPSLLAGRYRIPVGRDILTIFVGHLERLFHRHEGWKLHTDLSDNYAAVSRISGPLGVRSIPCNYLRP